ncbi:MAG: TIGR00730 family Rossman fold protein [Spirochaetota bacterium]
MESISRVCVFCGSSFGDSAVFAKNARLMGEYIGSHGMDLVFGGGNVGLMGECARACMEFGGRVTGIIPRRIHEMVEHIELTEIHVVETMHERKAMMYSLADCFVALPGGIGTVEELFEVYTWSQLGYLSKPVGILNIDGYYSTLLQFLDMMTARGFMKQAHRDQLLVSDEVEELFTMLSAADVEYVRKL